MTDTENQERYLRTPDAARYLGLSPRTLEKHRTFGTGPLYRKLGGRVVYRQEDLKNWAEQGVRSSTSDPGEHTVRAARPIGAAVSTPKPKQTPPPARRQR
jgi:predicted DNA-binding transcriptional regulator AlpA